MAKPTTVADALLRDAAPAAEPEIGETHPFSYVGEDECGYCNLPREHPIHWPAEPVREPPRELHIVFDGFPSHDGPRFIEVEDESGKSINAGEWRRRDDGFCELIIAAPSPTRE